MADYNGSYSATRANIASFFDPIEMPGGYSFSHTKTLQLIDLYYNSQFETGAEYNGRRKYFFNIVKPACDIANKFVDLDTKDVTLIPESPEDEHTVWVMQRDLKQWMKDEGFGELLNTIGFDYPKYGHVVIKKSKAGWHKVSLQNLRLDTATKSLEDSPFVYEIMSMTKRAIKDMGWDKEAVNELFSRNENAGQFIVYACYDYNLDEGKKWKLTYKADFLARTDGGKRTVVPEAMLSKYNDYHDGVVLYETEEDELPYKELKWESIPGRWLGFGFVEYLIDNQVATNEEINLLSEGLQWTAKKWFQTRDEIAARNIFTDAENGDIFQVTSEITPLSNEERNLPAFQVIHNLWTKNSADKTFSFDIARGENLPSQTPLGVAELSAGMVTSYFDLKRENFGIFIRDFILNHVLPDFKRQTKKEHFVKFLGSDKNIMRLHTAFIDSLVRKAILDRIESSGLVMAPEEINVMRQELSASLKTRKNLYVKISEALYSDVKTSVDVVVTGEQVDVGAKTKTLQTALQIVGSNPTILTNPMTRSVFFSLLELAGVSPVELGFLDDQLSSQDQSVMGQLPQGSPTPQQPQALPQPQI